MSFLFKPRPETGWSSRRRFVYWLWQLLWLSAGAVAIGITSLMLSIGAYDNAIFWGFFERPLIVFLNLAPTVALALLLYALTRRGWLAYLLDALVTLGLSAGNYYKLIFRDDPVMFEDLFILREAGNMAGKYHLFLNARLTLTLICIVAGTVAMALLVRGRPTKHTRGRAILGLMSAGMIFGLYPVMSDNAIYTVNAAHYAHLDNYWSSTQQYLAHGFVYPFVHSVSAAFETPPPGYDTDVAQAMAAAFQDADIPEDQKVNVVCIMLEAFQDFSRFGTPELAYDVYAPYHALEAESYTGDLVTNIFAGGTVDTERCFLTGYSQLPSFRSATNAYPWYFRSQGYQTTGYHPCLSWFYNRQNINQNLGFSEYYFMENLFRDWVGDPKADMATDNIFFPMLMGELNWREAGPPIFAFSVTYQGHGPYASDVCYWGKVSDYIPQNSPYTTEQQYILANYFGSVENTIGYLVELRDFLADRDEPYILIVFGDHNPWMGDGNSVYEAMGLDLDQSTQEGFSNYYSTRYLIWANDLAKETLGNDFVGEGPAMGPYFLMNQVFDLCGWEGPGYLQGISSVAGQVPVQHVSGRYVEDDVLTQELSAEGAALTQDYNVLQYYERHHFRYGDLTS